MTPLHKLLIENRGRGYFRAESKGDEATLYIYDAIVVDDYFGGVAAESMVKAINEIEAETIHLRINSPGGDVFGARAIEQALREHPAKVVAHIDGYAASAASFIAMAADEITIAEGGFIMVHKAWTFAFGNSDELMDTAALLEKVDGTLVKTYANRTGREVEEIENWMKAETWFTAEEAIENGFADSVSETNANAQAWALSAYQNPPDNTVNVDVVIANTEYLRNQLRLHELNL